MRKSKISSSSLFKLTTSAPDAEDEEDAAGYCSFNCVKKPKLIASSLLRRMARANSGSSSSVLADWCCCNPVRFRSLLGPVIPPLPPRPIWLLLEDEEEDALLVYGTTFFMPPYSGILVSFEQGSIAGSVALLHLMHQLLVGRRRVRHGLSPLHYVGSGGDVTRCRHRTTPPKRLSRRHSVGNQSP